MDDPPLAPPLPRRTRRKRPAAVIIAELRALAGIVLERAIAHEGEAAQEELVRWAQDLAAELDLPDRFHAVSSWGDLALALAQVHAAADGATSAPATQPRARQRMRRTRA